MVYTSHGHHIPGTTMYGHRPPTARCGGPGLCPKCSTEASMFNHPSNTTLHGKSESMLDIQTYSRRSFDVEAVEVTTDNMAEVAEWCGGEIKTPTKVRKDEDGGPYIEVPVKRATVRQRQARPGFWVLKGSVGFKVYTPDAFGNVFQRKEEN